MSKASAWKLGAGFGIFATGAIGCAIAPIVGTLRQNTAVSDRVSTRRKSEESSDSTLLSSSTGLRLSLRFLLAVGCGVIICTGFMHTLVDAAESMENSGWLKKGDEQYPLAHFFAMLATLLLYMFESELHHMLDHTNVKEQQMHILESGVVVHSVLVGFSLGLLDKFDAVRGLTIALLFHQLCEGFAIGSAIQQAGVEAWKQVLYTAMFALSTPLGVGIGAIVSASPKAKAESRGSQGAQGVLGGLSAGILIYTGLSEFLPQLQARNPVGEHHGHQQHCRADAQVSGTVSSTGGNSVQLTDTERVVEAHTHEHEHDHQHSHTHSPQAAADATAGRKVIVVASEANSAVVGVADASTASGEPGNSASLSPRSDGSEGHAVSSLERVLSYTGILLGAGGMAILAIWA